MLTSIGLPSDSQPFERLAALCAVVRSGKSVRSLGFPDLAAWFRECSRVFSLLPRGQAASVYVSTLAELVYIVG